MHFTQGFVPLQLWHQFCAYLLVVGIFGSCALFCLSMMIYHGTEGIELASVLCIVGLFGLERLLIPTWSTVTSEEDLYLSSDSNRMRNFCSANLLIERAVETKIHGVRNKKDDAVFVHHDFRNSPCSICLQCFETGEHVAVVCRCNHAFHSKCLQKWIQKSATCPYCRQDLERKSSQEEE